MKISSMKAFISFDILMELMGMVLNYYVQILIFTEVTSTNVYS